MRRKIDSMTLPVLTTGEWCRVRSILASVSIAIMTLLGFGSVALTSAPFTANPHLNQTDSESAVPYRSPQSKTFVYDYAGVLTREQAERHKFDLKRLNEAGIPVVVYIRRSDDSRKESVAYAELVRNEWELESAPGADDGIVILVTLSDLSPVRNSLVMSLGRNALPIGQLKSDTLQDIYDKEMQPAFRRNEIDLAISYGVRRILYYEGYTPPDPAPLSGGQETARSLAPWFVLFAALFGVFGPILSMLRARLPRRSRRLFESRRLYFVVLGALLVLAAATSLYGRSETWLMASILVVVALFLGIRLVIAWRARHHRGPAVTRVRSRGTRSRQAGTSAYRSPRSLRNV